MTKPFEASIARLRTADGSIVGAGFLVTGRHILTCAHVVADALGIPRDAEEKPITTLHLDFPLVAPDDIRTAHVTLWQSGDDIAVLELEEDPPAAARPVRLVTAQDLWLHPFRAFGFPTSYDDGVWASGVLRGRQATGWVQIEDLKEPGYWVQPGFSGTPVWDEQLNGVVGMAVAADVQPGIKAAFMIPARSLIAAWPDLALRTPDVNDLVYLEKQLAVLETAQRNASDPRRFQPRIDELRAVISNWEGRVEQQRQRIAEGLEEQRQQIVESTQRRDEKRLRVIGRCPLDVTDYFKDRQRELMTIGELLAQPTTRLVSIIGHGGMGKTALACKILRDVERHCWPHTEDELPLDGIVYLSTRTVGISLERLFLDCAKLLSKEKGKRLTAIWTNPHIGTEDKTEHLLEALSDGRYVILLDNIEDLLDDAGQFADQDLQLFFEQGLVTAHGVQLLVTSRVALAFKPEMMRFDRQVKLLEGLPIADGVALLRELDPNREYGLQDAPETQLAQAVTLTHGMPRALEVLAGILANDPFASLAEVLRGFYEQEDVVQALIEENYRRLNEDARRVIEGLAVFRRPVPPLAVDYLLEPFAPGLDVPGVIRRLTRTSIVSVDRATKTVTLHPIDRDYAYSQLPEEESSQSQYTRQALEHRAAEYYVELRTQPETWKTIEDLEPQLLEFEHRLHAQDYTNAYRLIELIAFGHLYAWGYYTLLINLWEQLREHLVEPHLKTALLGHLGICYRVMGEINTAISLTQEALDIAQAIGDQHWESSWLANLGIIYLKLGRFEQAIPLLKQALAIARSIGQRSSEGTRLNSLAYAYRNLGNIDEAIELYQQAIAIARETRSPAEESYRLLLLGEALLAKGASAAALRCFSDALALDVPSTSYRAALAMGITLLQQHAPEANMAFADAVVRCNSLLEQTEDVYRARYVRATALLGRAACNPDWAELEKRDSLLSPILAEYRSALSGHAIPNVIIDTLHDLEQIRAAGIENLEGIFRLLQSYVKEAKDITSDC